MSGWLIDILPPEAQTYIGIIAIAALLLGLILWAAGVKVARAAVAILTGALAAALAAWWLPRFLGLAPLSSALIGFAAGSLLGAIAFRVVQGMTLAACVALAVAGGYYRWEVLPPAHGVPAATVSAAASQEGVRAADLLVRGPLAAGTRSSAGPVNASFSERLADRWTAIPSRDQTRMEIASLGAAAAILLLAFGLPRITTWIVTAALGATMILAGAEIALHVYAPQAQTFLPGPLAWYIILAALAVAGLLFQRWLFWPADGSRPKSKMARGIDDDANPAPRTLKPGTMGKPPAR